jgi:hypothetical protein
VLRNAGATVSLNNNASIGGLRTSNRNQAGSSSSRTEGSAADNGESSRDTMGMVDETHCGVEPKEISHNKGEDFASSNLRKIWHLFQRILLQADITDQCPPLSELIGDSDLTSRVTCNFF